MRPRLPRLPKIDGNSLERGPASASARISVEVRIVPSGKRGGVGVTDDATESGLKLQLVHLTLKSLNLVLLDGIKHLLDSSSRVRIDGCGVLSRIVVHTINGTLSLAAASGKLLRDGCGIVRRLQLEVRLSERDLLTELTDVALQLVAEVADAVAELHSLLDVLVRQTTNGILKVVEVHGIAQTCLSDRLAIRTTTSIPASTEHEQEQHDNPPGTVAASAIAVIVATSDSGDVRQAHVFHFVLLS